MDNQTYPQCNQANSTQVYVAVHAGVKGSGLAYASTVRLTFGMALWFAIVVHIIGVEVYVRIISTIIRESYSLNVWHFRSNRQNLRINTDVDLSWSQARAMNLKNPDPVIVSLTVISITASIHDMESYSVLSV